MHSGNSDYARVCFRNKLKTLKSYDQVYSERKEDDLKETFEGLEIKVIGNLNAGILDYAHLSLPVHPENFYYGRNGKYKSCLTYSKLNIKEEKDDLNFSICKNENWLGKLFDVWETKKTKIIKICCPTIDFQPYD